MPVVVAMRGRVHQVAPHLAKKRVAPAKALPSGALDTDGDGRIGFFEFQEDELRLGDARSISTPRADVAELPAGKTSRLPARSMPALGPGFRQADADDNGYFDAGELARPPQQSAPVVLIV